MNSFLLSFLIFLYGTTGIISILAYWPTIKDLYAHKKKSANITSYALWTVASLIGWLYSIFILPDFWFQLISFLHFLACAVILILTIRLQ